MREKLFVRLANLYDKMQTAYAGCATEAGLSCAGCQHNCCTSYFKHHTYIEWLYLWKGLRALPNDQRLFFIAKAQKAVQEAEQTLSFGATPTVMCPLNEGGLCVLYKHRLMICRMHGTRNTMSLPSGETRVFSGCLRFTALYPQSSDPTASGIPTLDRTDFYRELASIEMDLLKSLKKPPAKVALTLSAMIASGAPRL